MRTDLHAFIPLVLGGLLMTTPAPSKSQTTDGATSGSDAAAADPVVEALERRKKIAELEKAIADAEKAKRAAELPTTEGSGVTGDVTFGAGSGYFAEMLAYRSLLAAAAKVAERVGAPDAPDSPILLVADDDLAKQALLWEIAATRLDDATQRLEGLLANYPPDYAFAQPEAVAAALTTATAILGAAADIASFFRSDLAVTARSVAVTPTALVASTAAELRKKGWQPVRPGASFEKTALLARVEALLDRRRELAGRRFELEQTVQADLTRLAELQLALAEAEADLKKLQAAKSPDPAAIAEAEKTVRGYKAAILPLSIKKARWEKVAAEIDATLTATDALVKALVEGSEGKPSPLEAVAAVDVAKANPDLRVLFLEASSQGGEMHVSKSAWKTRLTYVGGVAVSYLLSDQKGTVLASGVVALPRSKSTRAKDAEAELALP